MRFIFMLIIGILFVALPILVMLLTARKPPKTSKRITASLIKPLETAKTDYRPYQLVKKGMRMTNLLAAIITGTNNEFMQSLILDIPTYNPTLTEPGIYFNLVGTEPQIIVKSGTAIVRLHQTTMTEWELRDPSQLDMLKDIEYLWNNDRLVSNALLDFAKRVLHKEEIVGYTHMGMKRLIYVKVDYGIPYLYIDRGNNKSIMSFCVYINRELYSVTTDVDGIVIKKDGIDIDTYQFYKDVLSATQVHSVRDLNFVME